MPTVAPLSPISAEDKAPGPAFDRLAQAIGGFAIIEGVTPSPLPNVWALKLTKSLPYHRGRSRGLSVAVATSGRKIVDLGGSRAINDRGHIIAMHGNAVYDAVVQASDATPYIALKLQLPPELLAESLIRVSETGTVTEAKEGSSALSCEPLDEALVPPLIRLLDSFRDPVDCHVLAPLCLQEICYRILRSNAFSVLKSAVTEADTRLVKAMRFIEAHAHRSDLSIDEIASEIAMSPSRFAHRFTALLGLSPMQYRKQIRLEKARQYLLSSDTSVSMAAEAAGYASTSHFGRDFKSAFGLAPRQYADALSNTKRAMDLQDQA